MMTANAGVTSAQTVKKGVVKETETHIVFDNEADYLEYIKSGKGVAEDSVTLDMNRLLEAEELGGAPHDYKISATGGEARKVLGVRLGAGVEFTQNQAAGGYLQATFHARRIYFGLQGGYLANNTLNEVKTNNVFGGGLIGVNLFAFGNKRTINARNYDASPVGTEKYLRDKKNEFATRTWNLSLEGFAGWIHGTATEHYESEKGYVKLDATYKGSTYYYGAALVLDKRFLMSNAHIGLKVGVRNYDFTFFTKKENGLAGYASIYLTFGTNKKIHYAK